MTEKEYIEREKVLELIDSWNREEQCCKVVDYIAGWNEAIEQLRCNICEDIPTADVAPVVHGYWIETANTWTHDYYEANSRVYRCSKCGRVEKIRELYCNCGAFMDGKE